VLRAALEKLPELPVEGSAPVEAEWLAHVHVAGPGRGNVGLLKGARLSWPPLLSRAEFAEERDRITELLTRARANALTGPNRPQPSALRVELRERVAAWRQRVEEERFRFYHSDDSQWRPQHFSEALRYLQEVAEAVRALEQPNAAFYLDPLQGRTVAELVTHMKKKGLAFAPATTGGERSYVALHRALAREATRLLPPSSHGSGPAQGASRPR
jgi:hypothetical protein